MSEVQGILCIKCKSVVVSWHQHDFRYCQCKAVAVDGGRAYTRIVGNQSDWKRVNVTLVETEES